MSLELRPTPPQLVGGSGRSAWLLRAETPSAASCADSVTRSGSNPFACPDDAQIQLDDFSFIQPKPDMCLTPPLAFVSEHPSVPRGNVGLALRAAPRRPRSDCGKVASDWETIAPDDELYTTPIPLRADGRDVHAQEVVFHAHDILGSSQRDSPCVPRRNTVLGPAEASFAKLLAGRAHDLCETRHPSLSSSSVYASDASEARLSPLQSHCRNVGPMRPGAGPPLDRDACSELSATNPEASSGTRAGCCRDDGQGYAACLHASPEEQVCRAPGRVRGDWASPTSTANQYGAEGSGDTRRRLVEHSSFYDSSAFPSA